MNMLHRALAIIITLVNAINLSASTTPRATALSPIAAADTVRLTDCREMVPASFLLGKTNVNSNPQLDSLAALINRTLTDSTLALRYIRIGGMASPDGPEALNVRLSGERAEAVAQYLRTHTHLSPSNIRSHNFGEAWGAFRDRLNERGYDFNAEVFAIIDTIPNLDQRELALRKLHGGRVWQTLKSEVFPTLRCTMVEICRDSIALPPESEVLTPTLPEPADTVSHTIVAITPEAHEPAPVPEPEPEPLRTRFIAIKTNALHLLMLSANAGIEVQVADRWSIDIPVWYSPYNMFSTQRKWRLLAVQPEGRRWLKQAGEGHFLGLHAHLVGFNVAFKETERYQDPNHAAWGFGLGYGFAKTFGKQNRWAVDFNIGAGFVDYKYDVYSNRKNGPILRSGSGTYWGITRLGVSLAYRWHWTAKQHTRKGGEP